MRKLQLLLILLFATISSFGQDISFGGKIGYVTYHRTYAPSIEIEGTQIYQPESSTSFRDGWRFAAFSQLSYNRLAARVNLAYAYNIGGGSSLIINNRNNPLNEHLHDNWTIGTGRTFRNVELNVLGATNLLTGLQFGQGPGCGTKRCKILKI